MGGYPNHQQQSRRTPVKMRTYDDTFSGEKIYPGKGKLYVRGDSKIFRFQNGKTESLFLQRKNPRRIAWTVLFRRQHKKGISEEVAKKRSRRTVKSQRAIVGASLDVIKERRSQRPEARSAARQAAIKEGKEKRAAARAQRRLRRRRTLPVLQRETPESQARWVLRVRQRRSRPLLVKGCRFSFCCFVVWVRGRVAHGWHMGFARSCTIASQCNSGSSK